MRRSCPKAWAEGVQFSIGLLDEIDRGEIDLAEAGLPPLPRNSGEVEPWVDALAKSLDVSALVESLYLEGIVSRNALVDPAQDRDALAFAQGLRRTMSDQLTGRLS